MYCLAFVVWCETYVHVLTGIGLLTMSVSACKYFMSVRSYINSHGRTRNNYNSSLSSTSELQRILHLDYGLWSIVRLPDNNSFTRAGKVCIILQKNVILKYQFFVNADRNKKSVLIMCKYYYHSL